MRDSRAGRRASGRRTISDVASHAGVSAMTVSRVINGQVNVSDDARRRVNAAIADLDYAPDPSARNLATARTLRVGLLYGNPSASYLSEFLLGGLDACSRLGAQLLVEKCDLESEVFASVARLLAMGVDGVILPPPLCENRDLLAHLDRVGIARVLVANGQSGAAGMSVSIDDFKAAHQMTQHLLEHGHTRIGFIHGNPNQSASARRYDGYVQALDEAGVSVDPALVRQGLFTYVSGLESAESLLTMTDRPSAIFASNDDMAAATVAVAHRLGLDVPSQLSVCGFDDTALATTIWPPLTTIRQPVAVMAGTAVQMLRDALGTADDPKNEARAVVLPALLVERASVATLTVDDFRARPDAVAARVSRPGP